MHAEAGNGVPQGVIVALELQDAGMVTGRSGLDASTRLIRLAPRFLDHYHCKRLLELRVGLGPLGERQW